MKKIAIVQSNYIPWKGYFHLISSVDELILYDDMQYTRRDWRNRNQIKTPQGLLWLTVPVKVKGKYFQSIRETQIDNCEWQSDHWKSLMLNYRRAPYYEEISRIFESIFIRDSHLYLSELNLSLINLICKYLEIDTKITQSSQYTLTQGKTQRLVDLCIQAGASEYVSGPSARDYIEPDLFSQRDIRLSWFDYSGYPEYQQLWGPFVHGVSILDLLFNCGKDSIKFINRRIRE